MGTKDTTFEALIQINNPKHVKVKGIGSQAQKYLSWTFAWETIKTAYPDANYKVLDNADGMPYFVDDFGIMIKTEVTVNYETLSMWLPVLDGANNAMKKTSYQYKVKEWINKEWTGNYIDKEVAPATMFDINTATMRCLVKNFAMFGLYLHLYKGEEFQEKITINLAQNSEIMKLILDNNLDLLEFCSLYGMQKPMELHDVNFNHAIELLENVVKSKKSIAEYTKPA